MLFNILYDGKYTISRSNNCSNKTQAPFKRPVFNAVVSEKNACIYFSVRHQGYFFYFIQI